MPFTSTMTLTANTFSKCKAKKSLGTVHKCRVACSRSTVSLSGEAPVIPAQHCGDRCFTCHRHCHVARRGGGRGSPCSSQLSAVIVSDASGGARAAYIRRGEPLPAPAATTDRPFPWGALRRRPVRGRRRAPPSWAPLGAPDWPGRSVTTSCNMWGKGLGGRLSPEYIMCTIAGCFVLGGFSMHDDLHFKLQ